MGKGHGEHPPLKFINDQCFCQVFLMVFMGFAVTLSGFSAGMDDGGSFPHPYFFTGFILAPLLLTNLVSRGIVVKTIKEKGLSRKNILDVLNTTFCGNIIWPWSCRIGMLWCIPGCILTGLGGVNCGIEEKEDGNTTVKNTCYFDIEGEHGDMYKGLAIGLVVIHVFSFIFLLLSNCPVNSVLDQIKEDPKRNTVAPAQQTTSPQQVTATNTGPTTSPATNQNAENLARATANSGATNQSASGGQDIEMKALKKELDERSKELERREREISERERRLTEFNTELPPPPSYNEINPI